MDRTRKILHNYNLLFPEYFLMLILVMTNKQHNFYIFITIIQKGTLTVFSTPKYFDDFNCYTNKAIQSSSFWPFQNFIRFQDGDDI